MAKVFRLLLSVVRCRLEGLLFLLLMPGLLALYVCLSLLFVVRGDGWPVGIWRTGWRRWRVFILQGLRPLRNNWWIPLSLEGSAATWRYLVLIELLAMRSLRASRSNSDRSERILVIRLGHIGDYLQAIPMLRALRRQKPEAFIAVLVGPWNHELAMRFTYYDKIINYRPELRQYHRAQRNIWSGWIEEYRLLKHLGEYQFDTVLSLESHQLVDVVLAYAVSPRRWVEFEQPWTPYDISFERRTMVFNSREYEGHALMHFLSHIGLQDGAVELDFPLSVDEQSWAEKHIGEHGLESSQFVMLAPGAGWFGKLWVVERYAQIADWLLTRHGLKTVLVGSASERSLGRQIEAAATAPVVNLMGQTSLGVVGALAKQALFYLGNDNGLLHIAAAVGVPTVALFGPTFAEKWAPRGPLHRVVQQRDKSCPLILCYPWHPLSGCGCDQACMCAIEVVHVQQAIDDLLKAVA